MNTLLKPLKDRLLKLLWGKETVPQGLVELSQYFYHFGPIDFRYEREEDGSITAISTNFKFGSIITTAVNPQELEQNIKDAILTSFEIPSSFAQEADIRKVDGKEAAYALA